MIAYCEQDCVVVRTPSPTIRTRCNPSMPRPILTLRETAWCCVHALNSFSTVACAPQAPRGSAALTRKCPRTQVYFSIFEPIELTSESIMWQTHVI